MAHFSIISSQGQHPVLFTGTPRYVGAYLKPGYLEFPEIGAPTAINWHVGDYVVYSRTGRTYRLYGTPQAVERARSNRYGAAFLYENVQFFDDVKQLELCPFSDLVPGDNMVHFSTQGTISFFGKPSNVAERIQACLENQYGSGSWAVKVVTTSDADLLEILNTEVEFSVSGVNCLDVLDKVYETWNNLGWSYTIENGKNTIIIGEPNDRTAVNTTEPYSFGNGLIRVEKSIANANDLGTRLFAYGSMKNMDATYYRGLDIYNAESVDIEHLMIPVANWGTTDSKPDARKAFIQDAAAVANLGLIPRTAYFDGTGDLPDIHPTIEQMTIGEVYDAGGAGYVPNLSKWSRDQRIDEIVSATNPSDQGAASDMGRKLNETISSLLFEVSVENTEGNIRQQIWGDTITKSGRMVIKFGRNPISFTTMSGWTNPVFSNILLEVYGQWGAEYIPLSVTQESTNVWLISLPESVTVQNAVAGPVNLYISGYVLRASDDTYSNYRTYTFATDPDTSLDLGVEYTIGKTFSVRIPQIGFDIEQYASLGAGKTLSMKTGMCAGRDFEIKSVAYQSDTDSWLLTLYRSNDEDLNILFPNADYQIVAGDQFVLLDIAMPEMYVTVASNRLLSAAQKLLSDICTEKPFYAPQIDAKVVFNESRLLLEGLWMDISFNGVQQYAIIDSITIDENGSNIPTYEVALREKKGVDWTENIGSSSSGKSSVSVSGNDAQVANGTVSSVGLTVPTGLEVVGSPITSSGIIKIQLAPGYKIPLESELSGYFEIGLLPALVQLKSAYSYFGARDGLFFTGGDTAGPVPDIYVDTVQDSSGNPVRVLRTPLAFISDGDQIIGDGTPGSGGGGGGASYIYELKDTLSSWIGRPSVSETQVLVFDPSSNVHDKNGNNGAWKYVNASSIGGVTSVVGQTGVVTAAQIATALTSAGYKLTDHEYSNGYGLDLSNGEFSLTQAVRDSLGLANTALQAASIKTLTLKVGTTTIGSAYNPIGSSNQTLTIAESNLTALLNDNYHPLYGEHDASAEKYFWIGGAKFVWHPAVGGTDGYLELQSAIVTTGDQIVNSGTPGGGGSGGGAGYLYELGDVYHDNAKTKVLRPNGQQRGDGDVLSFDSGLGVWVALQKSSLLAGYALESYVDSEIWDSIQALNLGAASTYGVGTVASGNNGLVTGGSVYSAINDAVSSALKFQGTTTIAISDGSTTNPIVIGGSSYTAKKGDVVLYDGREFLWTGSAWEQLGDEVSWALKTTTISAGTGLTGGGSLAANRSISLNPATIASLALADTAYQKPSTGIPKGDLASGVQTSLGLADSAYQKPNDGIPNSDLKYSWVKVGTTQISLGGQQTSLAGLVNVAMSGKLTIGSAEIEWVAGENGNPGYLKVNQALLTTGDQIVNSGTPGGGGGGGAMPYMRDIQDVSLSATVGNGDLLQWNGSAWVNVAANTVGVTTLASASAPGLMSSADYLKLAGIANGATNVTESTVSGWGFTKNAGTVTSVKVGSTSYSPSSGVVSLPAYPTTLPASDVYAWAKAATKPSYTLDEVTDGSTRKLANYVLKAGDTMTGDLIIEKTGGGLTIRGERLNSNADGGYIYLAARYYDHERNGVKIAAVYPGSGAYDIQDLVFYSSDNRSWDASPIWQEAMRIKSTKAVSVATSLAVGTTLSVSGLATLSGGASIPVNKKLTIGDAEIEWIPNDGNGYLRINKPLLTVGDQIVNSGTPGGGGGGGGAGFLYELGDVLTDSGHTVVKQYNGTDNAANNNLFAFNGSKWYALKLGTNLAISNGTLNATDTTYSNGTGLALSNGVFSITSAYQTKIDNGASAYSTLTASQAKNKVLASPSNESGAPSFRALVAADIPPLTVSKISDIASNYVSIATANTISAKHTFSAGLLLNTANSWSDTDRALYFSASDDMANLRYYSTDASKGLTFNPYSGALKAGSFVKLGGGSGFLKADGSEDTTAYLPLAGGTMTGSIKLTNGTYINAESGYAMCGIGSGGETFYCGPGAEITNAFYIRSGNINLTHVKAGTNYTIWDASNSNLSTVDWAANNLTAAGTGTFSKIALTSTTAEAHIAFGREGANYITAPASGGINFVPNGLSVSAANSRLSVADDAVSITKASGGAMLAIQGTSANLAAGSIWFRARSSSYNGVMLVGNPGATSGNAYDRISLDFMAANATSSSSVTWKRALRITYSGNVIVGASGATSTYTQYGNMTVNGSITSTGDQVISSDASLKKNWRDLKYGVADIAKATAGVFDWKDGKGESAGTKAQDWMHLVPQLVHGEEGHMTLAYGQIAMLNTILLARRSEDHETRIKALELENAELRKEIERLRS